MSAQTCDRDLCNDRAVAFEESEFLCELHAPLGAEVTK